MRRKVAIQAVQVHLVVHSVLLIAKTHLTILLVGVLVLHVVHSVQLIARIHQIILLVDVRVRHVALDVRGNVLEHARRLVPMTVLDNVKEDVEPHVRNLAQVHATIHAIPIVVVHVNLHVVEDVGGFVHRVAFLPV